MLPAKKVAEIGRFISDLQDGYHRRGWFGNRRSLSISKRTDEGELQKREAGANKQHSFDKIKIVNHRVLCEWNISLQKKVPRDLETFFSFYQEICDNFQSSHSKENVNSNCK